MATCASTGALGEGLLTSGDYMKIDGERISNMGGKTYMKLVKTAVDP